MENRTCGHGRGTDEVERDEHASLEEYYIGFNAHVLQEELTMLAFKNQVGEGSKFACASHLRSILPWVFYKYQLGILGQMRLVCVCV